MTPIGMPSGKKYKLTAFFDAHWDKYVKSPAKIIKPEHYKAVNAMRACRTEKLGIEIYVCPECAQVSEVYHSCKNRFCPTCSWKDTMKWAEKAYTKLLNIEHRHAVATIPHQLNQLLANNYKLLNNAVLKASSDTVKDWMAFKFNLTPGIMSVLHTFGEKKNQHNHAHMIVSMGGINKQTGELQTVALDFIPYSFLSQKFRVKFQDILIKLFDNDQLIHTFNTRNELLQLLKKTKSNNWRFHFEPPMKNPEKVIKYIGRYSKRACISEQKIIEIDDENINFIYKDNKDRDKQTNKPIVKTMTMHYSEFFPTLLQHVPPAGYQIIRYYGLYANSCKIKESYKEKPPMEKENTTGYTDPKKCECCRISKELYSIHIQRKQDYFPEEYYPVKWPESVLEVVQKSFI